MLRRAVTVAAKVVVLGVAGLMALASALPAARADPRLTVPGGALRAAVQCPQRFHHSNRTPVLLVHGTGLNAEESWAWNYEAALPNAGFDWCAVTLPDRALGDIQVSAEYVVYAIERIHALTHRQVAIITHSQGGMEGRWAMRWWPRARAMTSDLIDLASPNHGIYAANACANSGNCWPAVWQMASGSHFLRALDSVSETPGAVAYTQIFSATDELVEPSSTAPLHGARRTANVEIQSLCPGRPVHHAGLLSDPIVWELVLDALRHPGAADASRVDRAACERSTMPGLSPIAVGVGNAFLYSRAAVAFEQHSGVPSEPALRSYARRYG